MCQKCDVMTACLKFALETGQDSGVWGGLSTPLSGQFGFRWPGLLLALAPLPPLLPCPVTHFLICSLIRSLMHYSFPTHQLV